jgi:hypothetical protein
MTIEYFRLDNLQGIKKMDLISRQKEHFAQARIKTGEGRFLLFWVLGFSYLRKMQKTFK